MNKVFRALLVVLICVGLIAGLVWAYTNFKTLPVTLNIIPGSIQPIPPTTSVTLYSDANATTEMVNLNMGDLAQGANTTMTIWAKNTGDTAINVQAVGDNVTWGTITDLPSTVSSLAISEIRQYTVTFSVSANATTGAQSFSIKFIEP